DSSSIPCFSSQFTCYVQGFYPGSVTVTWLENGKEMNTGSTPRPIETPEGLFKLRSTVAVQAVPEKNGSVFTCRVLHEGQDPLSRNATLWVAASDGRDAGERCQSSVTSVTSVTSIYQAWALWCCTSRPAAFFGDHAPPPLLPPPSASSARTVAASLGSSLG
uniref:Ig-like domain-containing protein n=1 Tax=Anas zonorhyncha TaxID=75864 RepID=A0A8B9ZTQ2_9AVES